MYTIHVLILKIVLQKLYCMHNIADNCFYIVYIQIHVPRLSHLIQGVPGGKDKTSGECSLC
jgi:hypothetical protein